MKFEEFMTRVQNLPLIDSEILMPGEPKPDNIKVQLARWVKSGRLIQLKRGIFVLAEPYRKTEIDQTLIASFLIQPSYISQEKSLEFHNLIPEAVYVYTCVTTRRPVTFETPLGVYDYRHLRTSLFWGYESIKLKNQTAFMATPEKALLDLIYLKHIKVTMDYLEGLRLQYVEKINMKRLMFYAQRFEKPGILKAAGLIKQYIQSCKKKQKRL